MGMGVRIPEVERGRQNFAFQGLTTEQYNSRVLHEGTDFPPEAEREGAALIIPALSYGSLLV
jgi:hypothetical protein